MPVDETTALAILARVLETCLTKDMPAAEVFAALNFLAARIPVRWPFIEFRQGLKTGDLNLLKSSLAAIRVLIRVQR
jgi:hypothetical protein